MTQHTTFAKKVMMVVNRQPGASDAIISKVLGCGVQQVNSECRHLENLGLLERRKIGDEPIGNWCIRNKPDLKLVQVERLTPVEPL